MIAGKHHPGDVSASGRMEHALERVPPGNIHETASCMAPAGAAGLLAFVSAYDKSPPGQ